MKKKIVPSSKDKEDWVAFTEEMGSISVKEEDLLEKKEKKYIFPKLDLHGFSLEEANKAVKKFVNESFNRGYKKLLVVTGKGSRSKTYDNPEQPLVLTATRRPSTGSSLFFTKAFT